MALVYDREAIPILAVITTLNEIHVMKVRRGSTKVTVVLYLNCSLLHSSGRVVCHAYAFLNPSQDSENQCCLLKIIAAFTVKTSWKCFHPVLYTLLQTVYQMITLKAGQAHVEVSSHCKSSAIS